MSFVNSISQLIASMPGGEAAQRFFYNTSPMYLANKVWEGAGGNEDSLFSYKNTNDLASGVGLIAAAYYGGAAAGGGGSSGSAAGAGLGAGENAAGVATTVGAGTASAAGTGTGTATTVGGSTWLQVGSTLVSTVGSMSQAQAQAEIAEYNAAVAAAEAEAAKQKALYDAEQSRDKFRRLMGRQRALYAKAGVDIASGSPLLMLADQASEAEKERLAILHSGGVTAASDLNKSSLYSMTARNASTAGYINAGSTFLSGMAQAKSDYYNMNRRYN